MTFNLANPAELIILRSYVYAGWYGIKASGDEAIFCTLITWELGPQHSGCSVSLSGALPKSPSGIGMVISIGGSVP